ncbi:MAG TPA: helix-turn-helix domain-containing protein [Candidatus Acidoferrales bacterium]|nr:helix-turn-helix domain-containing protein [Candidatus Acidoferrales bacterium]
MFRNEDLETLTRLGLTLLQARTYLTLTVEGSASMAEISKASGIARQDVYRTMPILHKTGLVEKIIKTPATYKALPIKDGLSLLLQQRKEEYENLQRRAKALIENMQEKKSVPPIEPEGPQFAMIYDQELLYQKFEKYNLLAQKSIDVSGSWPNMKWLISLCNCRDDLFTQAMRKGVRIRIFTERRGEDVEVDKNIVGMSKNPLFEVRFTAAPIPVKVVIYDEKEAYTSISTSPQTDMPMLWSNNPNFLRIMISQYNEIWNRAAKFVAKKKTKPRKKELSRVKTAQ